MKKQFCTILILALTLILLFVSMIAQAETQKPEFTFIHSTLNPPTHIDYEVNMDFTNRVEEKSNGRIKFDFFHIFTVVWYKIRNRFNRIIYLRQLSFK